MIGRIAQGLLYLAVPLIGLLWFGWDWRQILVLYWLENISTAVVASIKMHRAPIGLRAGRGVRMRVNGREVRSIGTGVLTGFFLLHFGIFTFVHGVFVTLLVLGVFSSDPLGLAAGTPFGLSAFEPLPWVLLLSAWIVGSIVQVVFALTNQQQSNVSAGAWMLLPYLRLFPLHFTVILSAFLLSLFPESPIVAIILIVLHLVFDILGAVIERVFERRASRRIGEGLSGAQSESNGSLLTRPGNADRTVPEQRRESP
ncbi:DUF6498-containing protein [Humidisolicoccus flavus]|uniref:DUF6498-containing protein n=1 Tax=Humidisolicoccus flavus TaxID=3111414 RepID=UPI0032567F34